MMISIIPTFFLVSFLRSLNSICNVKIKKIKKKVYNFSFFFFCKFIDKKKLVVFENLHIIYWLCWFIFSLISKNLCVHFNKITSICIRWINLWRRLIELRWLNMCMGEWWWFWIIFTWKVNQWCLWSWISIAAGSAFQSHSKISTPISFLAVQTGWTHGGL
jgi:hypothetical protein